MFGNKYIVLQKGEKVNRTMRSKRSILTAFTLNMAFAVFEFVGGLVTGSVAILSDALHDLGDAASIGISCLLEKKSRRGPDEAYTYGYARYSVLGGLITSLVLLLGSCAVVANAVARLRSPTEIDYDGMILFAAIGVCVNFLAVLLTRDGNSLGERAVNLHMLEDVLGWGVVLIGALVMRVTDLALIDPILSIAVAVFILLHAVGHMQEGLGVFLERAPVTPTVAEVFSHLMQIDGVIDVHHVHLWTLDGQCAYATLHAVAEGSPQAVKAEIRKELANLGILHVTVELEARGEVCPERECTVRECRPRGNHSHHHHVA